MGYATNYFNEHSNYYLSKVLGIERSTVARKLANNGYFTREELVKLANDGNMTLDQLNRDLEKYMNASSGKGENNDQF